MMKRMKFLGVVLMLAFSTTFAVGCGNEGEKQQEKKDTINI